MRVGCEAKASRQQVGVFAQKFGVPLSDFQIERTSGDMLVAERICCAVKAEDLNLQHKSVVEIVYLESVGENAIRFYCGCLVKSDLLIGVIGHSADERDLKHMVISVSQLVECVVKLVLIPVSHLKRKRLYSACMYFQHCATIHSGVQIRGVV